MIEIGRDHHAAPAGFKFFENMLDGLLLGDRVMQGRELVLPHPRAHLRAFVLWPLVELEPGLELPGVGPLGPWLAKAADQAIERIDAA